MCTLLFGREQIQQSRAFEFFIDYMFTNYKHLVIDSLPWWHRNGFPKSSADAIRAKMEVYGYQSTEEELLTLRHI